MFIRSKYNPIIKPSKNNNWESLKVYNCGAIYEDDKYHLFYRGVGKGKYWRSSIGHAVSRDGEKFKRYRSPILSPENVLEKRGVEDPRITKIGSTYYMSYAAYDGEDVKLNIATSKNLNKWTKRGKALSNFHFVKNGGVKLKLTSGKWINRNWKNKEKEWSKSGAIFPEKINGRYWMLFGEYRIWLASSRDCLHWQVQPGVFLKPRRGKFFDNTFVEMGPPPIKTKNGWLVLYHGIDKSYTYRLGFFLLDLKNTAKIIFRSNQAVFEPEAPYETQGIVDVLPGGFKIMEKMNQDELKNYILKAAANPKVIFCCGAVVVKDILRIYYGAGDSVIGTATAKLSDLLKLVE